MNSKYRKYIFLQLVIVILVIVTFRVIPEKRVASVVATTLFFLGAGLVLVSEGKTAQGRKSFSFLATLIFMVGFILPIIVLRLRSWDGLFEMETLFGVTGGQLHRGSNMAFMAMLACFFFDSLKEARELAIKNKKALESESL
jgi:hypothetical protein